MGRLDFLHFLLVTAAVLILLPSAVPDIGSDRAALLALRSAFGGRLRLWDVSNPTPCSWAGVKCSPDGSAVVSLRLPGMSLLGQLPANTISNLTSLQTLSLRYNALSGPIPVDLFSSLSSLRNLYLQDNSFSGEIPDSLFSLTTLVRLNLANNNFSGPLSPSFNNLTRLGTLFLQNNFFSGSIPDLNLPTLVQFDVSNNNLTGRIPTGLSRKPRTSFAGNSLCGAPLDSCGNEKPKKKLSAGAIAGIIIGSVFGFLLLLLLLFCLYRVLTRKSVKPKDKEKKVELPQERAVGAGEEKDEASSSAETTMAASAVAAKGGAVAVGGGKKSLIFFGNTGWSFDLEDLLRASAEVMGKGTFGTTYKAVLETGPAVAVKRLRDVKMTEKEFRAKLEEIGKLDHENLVPLRAYYYNNDEKLLVYDYLPLGSLSALIHGSGRTPLKWETRVAISFGTARGISYIHSQGPSISHGNIKSSNILLTRTFTAHVSDVGLAQLATITASPAHVAGYRAPEVTNPQKISQKADVYSFGVLLLELITGRPPADGNEGVDLPRWVQSVVREEWPSEVFDVELLRYQNVEDEMVQLLQLAVDCTAQYPDKRPSMEEVTSKIEDLCRRSLQSPSSNDIEEEQGDGLSASPPT